MVTHVEQINEVYNTRVQTGCRHLIIECNPGSV